MRMILKINFFSWSRLGDLRVRLARGARSGSARRRKSAPWIGLRRLLGSAGRAASGRGRPTARRPRSGAVAPVDRPAPPPVTIALGIALFVALLGTIAYFVGSAVKIPVGIPIFVAAAGINPRYAKTIHN